VARPGSPRLDDGDPFSFDPDYLEWCFRCPLRFLHDVWFRGGATDHHQVPERGPVVPIPLPANFHIRFLPLIRTDRHSDEEARDPAVVAETSDRVRLQMQQAIDAILGRRRSVFRETVFES
jgi:hypothetical protein